MRDRRASPGLCIPSPAVLCLVSCLLMLSGCVVPGTVPETVKIGLSAPFEGFYRDLGYEALYAVRLAVLERSKAGGIGAGRLVELVALNDLNETGEALAQAAEMAVDPGILGVIGGLSPRTARAVAPEYQRLGLSFVTPTPSLPELGKAAARGAARQLGARCALILSGNDNADETQAEAFASAFASEGGLVSAQMQPEGGPAIVAALEKMDEKPDVIFLAGETSRVAEWIRSLRASGFAGAIVGGPEVGSSLTVKIAGAASEGVFFVSPLRVAADDAAFRASYEELSGGVPPGPGAAWCYFAARDLLDAMDEAGRNEGQPTRSGVGAALSGQATARPEIFLYVIRDGSVWTPARF